MAMTEMYSEGGGSAVDLEALIPIMTSATAPSGNVTTNDDYNASYAGWHAFGNAISGMYGWSVSNTTGIKWLKYEFPTAKVAKGVLTYSVFGGDNTCILQGSNDDTNWDDLKTGVVFKSMGSVYYPIDNNKAYKYYRWYFPTFSNASGKGIMTQLLGTS